MDKFICKKVKQVFGEKYEVISMERVLGGAQKHTFLAKCSNGFCFIMYQWGKDKTFFEYDKDNAVFCSSSADLFEKNYRLMKEHGVRIPELYFIDRSKKEESYEYAFVEYISGHDVDYII